MIFKAYEKELNKAGYFISADQIVNVRGDVMGQMDPYGQFQSSDNELMVLICKAAQAEAQAKMKAEEEAKKPVKKAVAKKTAWKE
jgi:hypothetical protein